MKVISQTESIMKKNLWLTVVAVFIIGAGGISMALSKAKDYGNRAKTAVGV